MPLPAAVWNRHALLTCAEMQRAEQKTFSAGVPGISLMQRAGESIAGIIREKWKPCRVLVLCGPGNNGGDGYIIAEDLRRRDWDVAVAALAMPGSLSGDAAMAAKNWQGQTIPLEAASIDADLIVDALFGTGLARPLEGLAFRTVEKLAQTKIPVIAVDLPSGVSADTGAVLGAAPQAALTVTFFRKKIGHMLLPGKTLCGETVVADIGISEIALDEIQPKTAGNARDLWIGAFPFVTPESHKYARGHALIAGGAVMTGAARMAARAAQRIGAGLVTLGAPESAIPVYSTLESAIVCHADTPERWRELLADPKRNALLIGPGLGLGDRQKAFVLAALETKKPCVIDADALSNFAGAPGELLSRLHPSCILTPHEGEFARLFGRLDPKRDKLTRARLAAETGNCIVLIKGADTVIAEPSGFAIINGNAPPWLATAGSGDVLAGIILGLVTQHMPPLLAAAAGVWIHGDAAHRFGPGLIAEDLIETLPAVLRDLPGYSKGV
ncbi:MAG: NAD(P)H-hydrate dehydratase [Bdellovibrionales bacterium]